MKRSWAYASPCGVKAPGERSAYAAAGLQVSTTNDEAPALRGGERAAGENDREVVAVDHLPVFALEKRLHQR
jgi:hypothetical protein